MWLLSCALRFVVSSLRLVETYGLIHLLNRAFFLALLLIVKCLDLDKRVPVCVAFDNAANIA